jgi:hypothetical protein
MEWLFVFCQLLVGEGSDSDVYGHISIIMQGS